MSRATSRKWKFALGLHSKACSQQALIHTRRRWGHCIYLQDSSHLVISIFIIEDNLGSIDWENINIVVIRLSSTRSNVRILSSQHNTLVKVQYFKFSFKPKQKALFHKTSRTLLARLVSTMALTVSAPDGSALTNPMAYAQDTVIKVGQRFLTPSFLTELTVLHSFWLSGFEPVLWNSMQSWVAVWIGMC